MVSSKEFFSNMERVDPKKALRKLFNGVVATNKMIGLEDFKDKSSLIETQIKLVKEELFEIEEAVLLKDKCNFVKEVIDYLVVAGYLYYLKEEKVYDFLQSSPNPFNLSLGLNYEFIKKGNIHITDICMIFTLLDIDHMKYVKEVLKSNLSKFPTITELYTARPLFVKEGLIQEEIDDIQKVGRYTGVTCEEVVDEEGDTRLIFWSSYDKGVPIRKYLKPSTYKEADMSQCFSHKRG